MNGMTLYQPMKGISNMYTELKSYQIIIALLKEYGIDQCVLSAGSRNLPFVHSVEKDPYFKCYSVVDERSAGYFALGMAQQSGKPVVISCTSSTATCNYWPAIAEAFYQNVPIVVLTSDRDPARLGQHEDQMIDQIGMYDRHVRKSVNLPIVRDDADFHFCWRLVNEALMELDHKEGGPVHINVPSRWYSTSFTAAALPDVKRIDRIDLESDEASWQSRANLLSAARRVLVLPGQAPNLSISLRNSMEAFFHTFNSAISVEYMSNAADVDGAINTSVCFDGRYCNKKKFLEFAPDIVVSWGGNIMQGVKDMLRSCEVPFEHWLIDRDGKVCDPFDSITTVFECSPNVFLDKMVSNARPNAHNDMLYHSAIKSYADSVVLPDDRWTNIYAIRNVVERIPSGSILHMAINNAIRISNFFKLASNVRSYANIGTHGIDGCMSSLLGQAQVSDGLAFLIVGDLSFFYDMNSLRIRHVGNNVRILLLNNHGGEEFYYNGIWQDETSDIHTSARHANIAGPWAESCGFKYLHADDKASFDAMLPEFMAVDSNQPILFEIFSEMSTDSKAIYDFYDASRPHDAVSDATRAAKNFVKKTVGKETAVKIADKLGVRLR